MTSRAGHGGAAPRSRLRESQRRWLSNWRVATHLHRPSKTSSTTIRQTADPCWERLSCPEHRACAASTDTVLTGCTLQTSLLEELAETPHGLSDPVFVFNEGEADVTLTGWSESDAGADGDLGLVEEMNSEVEGTHLFEALR